MPIEHQVTKELGQQGAAAEPARDPAPLPRLCRQVLRRPARGVSPPRRPGRLGGSVPDHGAGVRSGDHPGVPRTGRGRLHLPWPAAGALVPGVRHRAGGSRGRVRRAHLAVDLRALPVRRFGRRGGGDRSAAGGCRRAGAASRQAGGGDLDDHALDAACEPGGVSQSAPRLRGRAGGRLPTTSSRRASSMRSSPRSGGKRAGGAFRSICRRWTGATCSATRSSTARRDCSSNRTLPPTSAPAACTRRPDTATKTSPSDRNTACRC